MHSTWQRNAFHHCWAWIGIFLLPVKSGPTPFTTPCPSVMKWYFMSLSPCFSGVVEIGLPPSSWPWKIAKKDMSSII